VVGDELICQESDGISNNEWLEAGEGLQVGGMILVRGILGVAAEWSAGLAAKGVYGVLYSNPLQPSFKTPVAVRPAKADINVACSQGAVCGVITVINAKRLLLLGSNPFI
jgi:hypothetical protein